MKKEQKPVLKVSREEKDAYQREVRGLEANYVSDTKKSERRAWMVATAFGFVTIIALGITGFTVHQYAQPIPEHILTLNKDTGEAQEVTLMPRQADYDEVTDNYWVSQYVVHHESYDYYSGEADYLAVGLMSSNSVAGDYQKRYTGKEALDKKWGDGVNISVQIKSIILDRQHQTATVRYTTTRRNRQLDRPDPPTYWIATLGYEFANFPMTSSQRYINPLGFRVTSFRTVEENATQVGN